jgi:hypothetical protein
MGDFGPCSRLEEGFLILAGLLFFYGGRPGLGFKITGMQGMQTYGH